MIATRTMIYAAERGRLIGNKARGVETAMERSDAHRQRHASRGLIRMSVGCEGAPDIWVELEQAL